MDSLTQDNEGKNKNPSGEIFTSPESSQYEATLSPEQNQSLPENETPIPESGSQYGVNPSPSSESPPPYVEDKRKKMIIFAAVIVLVFIIILLVIRFLPKGGSKKVQDITLNYWGLWEEKEIMQPILDDYKKTHSNITINYDKQDPKQYRERLQAGIERGEGPDMFRYHNTWVPMLVQILSPMPKTIYSDDEFGKVFYPVTAEDLKLSGNIYGIPLEIDGLLLFYNEDMLKGVNVTVPKTWSDIQSAAAKLTVKDKDKIVTSGIALGTAENIEYFSDILGLMLLQNGTQPVKSLFSCKDNSSTTCAVETLTFYRKFAETPNNVWDDTLDNSILAFAGGKVAMIFAPSWEAHVIKELDKGNKINFKVAPVPQLPCESEPCPSVNWATYWVEGVSNKSANQAASWEFLKYLSQADTQQKLFAEQVKYRKLFGEPYSRVDLGKSLNDNIYLAPLIVSAPSMKSFYLASRVYDGDTGIDSSLIKYMKDAINSLSQGASVETVLKTADSGFQQVYSRFGITASGN